MEIPCWAANWAMIGTSVVSIYARKASRRASRSYSRGRPNAPHLLPGILQHRAPWERHCAPPFYRLENPRPGQSRLVRYCRCRDHCRAAPADASARCGGSGVRRRARPVEPRAHAARGRGAAYRGRLRFPPLAFARALGAARRRSAAFFCIRFPNSGHRIDRQGAGVLVHCRCRSLDSVEPCSDVGVR